MAIELPVAAALGLRTRQALSTVALVNLITNPLLNLSGYLFGLLVDWDDSPLSALALLVPAELLIIVVEWRLLIWALGGDRRRLLIVSCAMNVASALAGLVFWIR